MGLISTVEAAQRLGVHRSRVHVLIREGRLPTQKIGGIYVIDENDLKLVEHRPTGRPRKAQTEKESKKKAGAKKRQ
jgi:excisionase family DNA binding protein